MILDVFVNDSKQIFARFEPDYALLQNEQVIDSNLLRKSIDWFLYEDNTGI